MRRKKKKLRILLAKPTSQKNNIVTENPSDPVYEVSMNVGVSPNKGTLYPGHPHSPIMAAVYRQAARRIP